MKSVVSVSGLTPRRTDTAAKPTTGLERFSLERPLARLGLFIGGESQVPYDYDDLLAAVARSRAANASITLDEPPDYQRFPAATQSRAIEWLPTQN